MDRDEPPEWLRQCREEGLDPAEVKLVLGRYESYRGYYLKGRRGDPLSLPNWFTWYRIETASETAAQGPSPSGCSVDNDAHTRGVIQKPDAFLKALASLAASGADS